MLIYLTTTFAITLLAWALLKYFKWKREVYYHIEKIGGPKAYPIIGNLYMFIGAKRADIFKIFDRMSEEHRPFYRTWVAFIPQVCIMKPEYLEQIMSSPNHITKARVYEAMKEWLGEGLLISDGAKWHQRRKMITPAFHFKILETFVPVFVEKSKLLLEHLNKECGGEGFDIFPYISHCALDIICETSMGVTVNAMSDRNSDYIRAIYDTSTLVLKRAANIFQQTPLYPFMKDGKAFYKNLKIVEDFINKVIKERREWLKENPIKTVEDEISFSKKKRLSFLDLLLDASENLTDEEIRAEVNTFMFGGHDTTTAGISWALFLFGLNQDVQERAYEEIKSVLGDKKTPETISELNDLKYLECCIKETIRLFPSVPIIGRKLTEDVIIDGYTLPKGTDCSLDIYHLHRDPVLYPDPKKYDPERFFPENCKNRHPYVRNFEVIQS